MLGTFGKTTIAGRTGTSQSFAFGPDGMRRKVNPLPEPGTYAMFLAGLGMVGLVARRRKQRVA